MEGHFSVAKRITADTQDAGGVRRIAAIDFGTTFCSLAYTLSAKDEVVNLSINGRHKRVPTTILLKKVDNTLTICKFGDEAQDEITTLSVREFPDYLYFECFKMKLRDEDVS